MMTDKNRHSPHFVVFSCGYTFFNSFMDPSGNEILTGMYEVLISGVGMGATALNEVHLV